MAEKQIPLLGESARQKRVFAKVSRRILPVLFMSGFMCYIDRTNLSFAALKMNEELGFGDIEYGESSNFTQDFFVNSPKTKDITV